MTFKTCLALFCLVSLVAITSCSKSKLTTMTERYTHELNGNFKFSKRIWVAGEQQPPVDTAFDIVVIHDSLLKIGTTELPLVNGGLAYKNNTVWADRKYYMLFGTDDTTRMLALKYFYATSTIEIEDVSANTEIKFTQVK